jgi:carbonic anhydrase
MLLKFSNRLWHCQLAAALLTVCAAFLVCALQEVPELSTRAVLLLHHTDCGAMAAMRHHDLLVSRMKQLLSEWGVTTWALQVGWTRLMVAKHRLS